jgi:multidrug efflux system membrane fusion protein
MQSRRPIRLTFSVFQAIVAGCAWSAAAMAQAPAGAPGVPVTVTKPSHQDVPVYLPGLGLVAAYKTVVLHPRVDGTLDRVLFTEGSDVKAGTLLAEIDPRPYQAALDQAIAKKGSDEAALVNARQSLGRSAQLARNQFETQATVDANTATVAQLMANIKGDEAAIQSARLNLDFTQITAPFDGRVGLRLTDPGNFIRAQDNTSPGIVALSQIKPISVTFTLPQDQLPLVTAAMAKGKLPVVASTADNKTDLATGEVLTIDNSIDTTTGTIKVKATFSNQDSRLWPGQFINAKVLVDTRRNVMTLPSGCIQRGPSGLFAYVVGADQTVKATPVDVVQDNGTVAVIGKGLTDDMVVVVAGQSRLSNGARVSATAAPGT